MPTDAGGIHLDRSAENGDAIAVLAGRLARSGGGAVGLPTLLSDLNRQAHRSHGWFGHAAHRAYTWDRHDRGSTEWWPQGISSSADASTSGVVEGRRVLMVTWYARVSPDRPRGEAPGSRLTFLDLDTLRYRHVLLVVPTLRGNRLAVSPLHVHAGGAVWCGPLVHVAATGSGLVTCRLDDLMRVPDGHEWGAAADTAVSSAGYRYFLPVRSRYRAHADPGRPGLRYSFLSLDRGAPASLVVGEYGRGQQTTRLACYPLDVETGLLTAGADGLARPDFVGQGVPHMQGAVTVEGSWYVTASRGPGTPGRCSSVRRGGCGPTARGADGPRGPRLLAVQRRALDAHRAPASPMAGQPAAVAARRLTRRGTRRLVLRAGGHAARRAGSTTGP
ncbi:MAG: hypothetical protein R2731_19120 [Nocardioides sp.]